MMEICKWREFVEDDNRRGSAARLNMVLGVVVGSVVVLWLAYFDKLTEGIFGIYMLATGGIYGFGKWRESVVQTEQIKADSPNQPAVAVPPVAPLGPTTVIQVGAGDKPVDAKDVNIKAQGDVNVGQP